MPYSVQRSITTKYQAASVVSTNISRRLGASSDLEKFAQGMTDSYLPKTLAEYKQYRKFAHDILCLGLIAGNFFDAEEFHIGVLGLKSNDPKLILQKPDLYTIERNTIKLCEISLTYDFETMDIEKSNKYNDLIEFVELNTGNKVTYTTLIVDLTDAEWEDSIPNIPENHKTLLKKFVYNLIVIHSTTSGSNFRKTLSQNILIDFPFSYDKEHISEYLKQQLGMKSIDKNDLNTYIQGFGKLDLGSKKVTDYLDAITDNILLMDKHDRPFPNNNPTYCVDYDSEWKDYLSRETNTSKVPIVLQLGAPNLTDEIDTISKLDVFSTLKLSKYYGGYLDLIKSSKTTDSDLLETGLIRLNLTDAQLQSEMLDGPGRKKYLKQNNIKISRSEPTHIRPCEDHVTMVNELMDIMNEMNPEDFLERKSSADYNICGNNLGSSVNFCINKLKQNGTDFLLQFYSRISTEIILNSMRRRKAREYVLCSSGFNGVFFMIAPGPQLRTESNIEFIKIISTVEPIYNRLSREWKSIGDHWESDWLSVDTDRLKHWARCRDRVNLSIIGSSDRLMKPGLNLSQCLSEEINNSNYSLMALIYLENKNSTSTTIQTTRYFLMKCLGDKNLKGLMSKFPERVSSVLQSLILIRNNSFVREVCSRPTEDFVRLQHIQRDENIGQLDETTTGVIGSIPRIFTSGNYVPIKYSINEIYWCMTYNKDRQNQTQDAMKILKKIAKEERKFDKEIQSKTTDKLKLAHSFGYHTTKQDLEHINSKNPESHYFSVLAVHIGMSLQDVHPENFAPNSSWISYSKINDILNKNLSEYATFKASVKSIKDQIINDDLQELKEIGKRTKCIELIYEIVNSEKLSKACEIAMSFSGKNSIDFKVVIQIFKKNQVGGVREILILFIKARILINLTEEICRLLSKSDKRETLTKGRDKRLMMRGDYEELSSSFPPNTPVYVIKNSYDMSTWCQKFIPTIFLPIYNHHEESIKDMIELCRFVMLKHCQKEIEYPNKLVTEWIKHPDTIHKEDYMQHYKQKFLNDREPKMRNFSNMGQGILHYNSTVLALSCQSLRDKLFYLCMSKLGKPIAIKWKTRVGSDDKGDTIFCDMSHDDYLLQAQLFEQCSSVSERLHAMELSVKSASGNIIYEFNSAYMANLEVQSPIIKFTLAATDMIGTDSCTDFINESYSRIRQLRENGASSLICYLAHLYNKDHFEQIFRTGDNMQNDPTKIFNLNRSNIPYDLGVYPMYDCDVQDMIGPEFHNYNVFTDSATPEAILRLLYTSHFDLSESNIMPDDDEGMFKKDDFRIAQGMVKQLSNMRDRLNLTKESIQKYLQENPFLIIRGPMTVEETAIIIAAKLYTRGASKSLRRTSPAIYMGRLSAFESAKAWNLFLRNEENADKQTIIKLTFKEYISTLYEAAKTDTISRETSIREFKPLLFPQYNSFDVVKQYVSNFGIRKDSHKMFSQSIRTWILNNFNYNFSNSLKAILETSFGMANKATRDDVMELRKAIPFDISTYEGFMENCRESNIRPLDLFFYLNKFYKNSNLKKAQVFATGPSTSSLNLTLSNLKRYNHLTGSIMELDVGLDMQQIETSTTLERDFEIMKLSFNMIMLETQKVITRGTQLNQPVKILKDCSIGNTTLYDLTETIIRKIQSISGFDNHIKRIIILLASYIMNKSEFLNRLIIWKQFSYTYVKRQNRSLDGNWYGDLSVIVNMANECFTINQVGQYRFIETMRVNNPTDFNNALKRIFRILNFTETDFSILQTVKPHEWYFSNNMVYESRAYIRNKQKINIHFMNEFKFKKLTDMTQFTVQYSTLKTGATIISLISKDDENKIEIAHFPGHYYPVEIPNKFKINEDLFINGLRGNKLFKNRKWFFDGRLFPFNTRGCIDILKNHLDLENMKELISNNRIKLEEYVNDMDYDQEEGYEDIADSNVITDLQLVRDLNKQNTIMNKNINLKDMFLQAAKELAETESDYFKQTFDEITLMDQFKEDAGIESFVRALGQNKQRKKKDFYMITNLKLNVNFVNRILDLFFKGNSIMSESSRELPDYALHCRNIRCQPEANKRLVDMLHNYICQRISILVGRDFNYVIGQIDSFESSKKNFNTLPRLNRYLTNESPTLFEMLDQQVFDGQGSDTEGEVDW